MDEHPTDINHEKSEVQIPQETLTSIIEMLSDMDGNPEFQSNTQKIEFLSEAYGEIVESLRNNGVTTRSDKEIIKELRLRYEASENATEQPEESQEVDQVDATETAELDMSGDIYESMDVESLHAIADSIRTTWGANEGTNPGSITADHAHELLDRDINDTLTLYEGVFEKLRTSLGSEATDQDVVQAIFNAPQADTIAKDGDLENATGRHEQKNPNADIWAEGLAKLNQEPPAGDLEDATEITVGNEVKNEKVGGVRSPRKRRPREESGSEQSPESVQEDTLEINEAANVVDRHNAGQPLNGDETEQLINSLEDSDPNTILPQEELVGVDDKLPLPDSEISGIILNDKVFRQEYDARLQAGNGSISDTYAIRQVWAAHKDDPRFTKKMDEDKPNLKTSETLGESSEVGTTPQEAESEALDNQVAEDLIPALGEDTGEARSKNDDGPTSTHPEEVLIENDIAESENLTDTPEEAEVAQSDSSDTADTPEIQAEPTPEEPTTDQETIEKPTANKAETIEEPESIADNEEVQPIHSGENVEQEETKEKATETQSPTNEEPEQTPENDDEYPYKANTWDELESLISASGFESHDNTYDVTKVKSVIEGLSSSEPWLSIAQVPEPIRESVKSLITAHGMDAAYTWATSETQVIDPSETPKEGESYTFDANSWDELYAQIDEHPLKSQDNDYSADDVRSIIAGIRGEGGDGKPWTSIHQVPEPIRHVVQKLLEQDQQTAEQATEPTNETPQPEDTPETPDHEVPVEPEQPASQEAFTELQKGELNLNDEIVLTTEDGKSHVFKVIEATPDRVALGCTSSDIPELTLKEAELTTDSIKTGESFTHAGIELGTISELAHQKDMFGDEEIATEAEPEVEADESLITPEARPENKLTKEVLSQFTERVGIDAEALANIEGIEQLTPGQQMLMLKNYETFLTSDIKRESDTKLKTTLEKIAHTPWAAKLEEEQRKVAEQSLNDGKKHIVKKMALGLVKSANLLTALNVGTFGAFEKVAGHWIEKGKTAERIAEDPTTTDAEWLNAYIESVHGYDKEANTMTGGPEADYENGKLQVKLLSQDLGQKLFGESVSEELRENFNNTAQAYMQMPQAWKQGHNGVTPEQKQQYDEAKKVFLDAKDAILENTTSPEQAKALIDLEGQAELQQLFASNPEATETLASMHDQWAIARGLIDWGTDKGAYMAGGAGARVLAGVSATALTGGIGLAAGVALATSGGGAVGYGMALKEQRRLTQKRRNLAMGGSSDEEMAARETVTYRGGDVTEEDKARLTSMQNGLEQKKQELQNFTEELEAKPENENLKVTDEGFVLTDEEVVKLASLRTEFMNSDTQVNDFSTLLEKRPEMRQRKAKELGEASVYVRSMESIQNRVNKLTIKEGELAELEVGSDAHNTKLAEIEAVRKGIATRTLLAREKYDAGQIHWGEGKEGLKNKVKFTAALGKAEALLADNDAIQSFRENIQTTVTETLNRKKDAVSEASKARIKNAATQAALMRGAFGGAGYLLMGEGAEAYDDYTQQNTVTPTLEDDPSTDQLPETVASEDQEVDSEGGVERDTEGLVDLEIPPEALKEIEGAWDSFMNSVTKLGLEDATKLTPGQRSHLKIIEEELLKKAEEIGKLIPTNEYSDQIEGIQALIQHAPADTEDGYWRILQRLQNELAAVQQADPHFETESTSLDELTNTTDSESPEVFTTSIEGFPDPTEMILKADDGGGHLRIETSREYLVTLQDTGGSHEEAFEKFFGLPRDKWVQEMHNARIAEGKNPEVTEIALKLFESQHGRQLTEIDETIQPMAGIEESREELFSIPENIERQHGPEADRIWSKYQEDMDRVHNRNSRIQRSLERSVISRAYMRVSNLADQMTGKPDGMVGPEERAAAIRLMLNHADNNDLVGSRLFKRLANEIGGVPQSPEDVVASPSVEFEVEVTKDLNAAQTATELNAVRGKIDTAFMEWMQAKYPNDPSISGQDYAERWQEFKATLPDNIQTHPALNHMDDAFERTISPTIDKVERLNYRKEWGTTRDNNTINTDRLRARMQDNLDHYNEMRQNIDDRERGDSQPNQVPPIVEELTKVNTPQETIAFQGKVNEEFSKWLEANYPNDPSDENPHLGDRWSEFKKTLPDEVADHSSLKALDDVFLDRDLTPTAEQAPDTASNQFIEQGPVTIKSGDTIWDLIGERLENHPRWDELNEQQQLRIHDAVENLLNNPKYATNSEELSVLLSKMGFDLDSSQYREMDPYIVSHNIFKGQEINLDPLFEKANIDTLINKEIGVPAVHEGTMTDAPLLTPEQASDLRNALYDANPSVFAENPSVVDMPEGNVANLFDTPVTEEAVKNTPVDEVPEAITHTLSSEDLAKYDSADGDYGLPLRTENVSEGILLQTKNINAIDLHEGHLKIPIEQHILKDVYEHSLKSLAEQTEYTPDVAETMRDMGVIITSELDIPPSDLSPELFEQLGNAYAIQNHDTLTPELVQSVVNKFAEVEDGGLLVKQWLDGTMAGGTSDSLADDTIQLEETVSEPRPNIEETSESAQSSDIKLAAHTEIKSFEARESSTLRDLMSGETNIQPRFTEKFSKQQIDLLDSAFKETIVHESAAEKIWGNMWTYLLSDGAKDVNPSEFISGKINENLNSILDNKLDGLNSLIAAFKTDSDQVLTKEQIILSEMLAGCPDDRIDDVLGNSRIAEAIRELSLKHGILYSDAVETTQAVEQPATTVDSAPQNATMHTLEGIDTFNKEDPQNQFVPLAPKSM